MLQGVLPFNPQHLPGLTWDLALNTAVLPRVDIFCRAKARVRAKTTAMPVAAERKFCTVSPLLFNALGGLALFALLMLQGVLPFNPQHLPGLTWSGRRPRRCRWRRRGNSAPSAPPSG
jgi:K+-transporting ATPase A subunit